MPSKLFKIAEKQKLDIQITIANSKSTYTTGDIIEGVAQITSEVDTRFDHINIEFVGTARTYNDCNIAAAAGKQRPEAYHQFLKLVQPNIQGYFPTDSILRAGCTCHIPFQFAVPECLLPGICNHNSADHAACESHLMLPPSLGHEYAENLMDIPDEMAPLMARVRYETVVRVTELNHTLEETSLDIIASKAKVVRVIPTVGEEPLLDSSLQASEYVTRKEKVVKKKFSTGKYGLLVAEVVQPQPVLFTSTARAETEKSTMVNVALRFDPANDSCSPPALRNLVSELKATTLFTTNVRIAVSTHEGRGADPYQGSYSEKVKLASRNTASEEWTKSGTSYTANLPILLTLPSNKTFVPTFHSCLISRIYTLTLTVNMNTPGSQTSLQLKLPFHITADSMVYQYSAQGSDSWGDVIIDDEKFMAAGELPPKYLDVSGLSKCLSSVSVVPC